MSALTRDVSIVIMLADLLDHTMLEEGREDIIAALSLYRSPHTLSRLQSFIKHNLPKRFDRSVQSALSAINHQLPKPEKAHWQQSLMEITSNKFRDRLKKFAASGFRSPLQKSRRSQTKIWDSFNIIIYDDGIQIQHPSGFSYFRERNS